MTECVFVIVLGDLRVAGRAGGEEHEHWVIAAGGVRRPLVLAGEERIFGVEVVPALALPADEDLRRQSGTLRGGALDVGGGVAVGGAEDGGDARRLKTVGEIVLVELIRRGDRDRAELMQTEDREPELVMTLEYEHHAVAALDAEGFEVVRALRGGALDVGVGEAALRLIAVEMDHGECVRLLASERVHHVECKVEAVLVHEVDLRQKPVFVRFRLDEILDHEAFRLRNGDVAGMDRVVAARLAGHDHGEEHAVRAAYGDHAVRGGTVVEDAVTFLEHLGMRADLHLQASLQNEVKLLTGVLRAVDRRGLERLGILVADPVRLGELAAEHRREIGDLDAVLVRGLHRLSLARDRVGGQIGAVSFENIRDLNAVGESAFV